MCECVACHEYDAKNLIDDNRRYEDALQKIVDMLGPTVASWQTYLSSPVQPWTVRDDDTRRTNDLRTQHRSSTWSPPPIPTSGRKLMSDQPLPREADDRGTLKKGVAVGRGPAPKYPPPKPPTPPIEPEADPLTAIDRAIRDHLFATAIREEAELIKELAPSHHCESHWAGNHCTVCSAHKGTALRTAERFNTYVAAQSADIDRLTRERDTWRQRAEEAEEVVTGVVEDRDAYANTLFAAERTVREQRDALERLVTALEIADQRVPHTLAHDDAMDDIWDLLPIARAALDGEG